MYSGNGCGLSLTEGAFEGKQRFGFFQCNKPTPNLNDPAETAQSLWHHGAFCSGKENASEPHALMSAFTVMISGRLTPDEFMSSFPGALLAPRSVLWQLFKMFALSNSRSCASIRGWTDEFFSRCFLGIAPQHESV